MENRYIGLYDLFTVIECTTISIYDPPHFYDPPLWDDSDILSTELFCSGHLVSHTGSFILMLNLWVAYNVCMLWCNFDLFMHICQQHYWGLQLDIQVALSLYIQALSIRNEVLMNDSMKKECKLVGIYSAHNVLPFGQVSWWAASSTHLKLSSNYGLLCLAIIMWLTKMTFKHMLSKFQVHMSQGPPVGYCLYWFEEKPAHLGICYL